MAAEGVLSCTSRVISPSLTSPSSKISSENTVLDSSLLGMANAPRRLNPNVALEISYAASAS